MTKAILITAAVALALLPAYLNGLCKASSVDLKSMLASPVDLTVYGADRKLVIGHSRYTIKESGERVEIVGNTHYRGGERDWEQVRLEYRPGNPLPAVISFQSDFIAANQSPELIEAADFKSGKASCRWSSQFEDHDYEDILEFEPDTYAGAASIIPLEYALKLGETSARFHVFDCTPKPTIFTVDAKLENGNAHWGFYPGELYKMGLTPDLGWLNLVARPFIPNVSVFFDPNEDYQYVGASKDRFYRGFQIILVRDHGGHPLSPEAAKETPSGPLMDHGKARN